jgi:hypothetical protein
LPILRRGCPERVYRSQFRTLADIGHYEMGGYLTALQNGGRWVRERWGK